MTRKPESPFPHNVLHSSAILPNSKAGTPTPTFNVALCKDGHEDWEDNREDRQYNSRQGVITKKYSDAKTHTTDK